MGAICALPISVVNRFKTSGHQNAVSIEISIASATSTESVAMTMVSLAAEPIAIRQPTPVEAIDRDLKSLVDKSPVDPTNVADRSLPEWDECQSEREPIISRTSIAVVDMPTIEFTAEPRPRRSVARQSKPPSVDLSPLEQVVGLAEKIAVDFSFSPPPEYPVEAVRDGLEGTVMLRLKIDSVGRVAEVKVVESSGHTTLDRAAVAAVSQWHGQPARRFGRATESVEVLPIRFRL
ncbi:Gram-negative bacterial tonB protein [Rubripirellula reticaptiva]|uniref:Gram-negative bacterial tonB protein n=2 Tax=Rubripirellula reticaptiva TaxID=2528013 RepID=A0A5C6F723_9BACT|nr:Gram-negative bacterial tonB protein [Rubripirellula reticaptiva]